MEKIYTILPKFFNNQCDSNEKKMVQEWKKEHPEEFKEHKAIWDLTGDATYVDFDAKEGWKELQPQLKGGGTVRSLGMWVRMAAAVVILVSGWFLLKDSALFGPQEPLFVEGINPNYGSSIRGVKLASQQTIQEQILKGGDKVWLNRNSSLEDLGDQDGTYAVKLHKGEAFFDVNSREKKSGGFAIHTPNAQVLVMGTGFSVTTKGKKTIVRVEEGIVKVKASDNKEVELRVGEQAVVANGNIKKLKYFSPNYLGWKNGELNFNGESLESSLHFFEEYYDIKIDVEKGVDDTLGGSYNLKDLTLDQILMSLCSSQGGTLVTVKAKKEYRIAKK